MSDKRYLVVEGPIGVGKTTLARRLAASFGSNLILEAPDQNPFLSAFYRQPGKAALPTQLHFLFQRVQMLEDLQQDDMFQPVKVADFMLEKDRIFAELTLTEDELAIYDKVYHEVVKQPPVPDLVVYLQAPANVLADRVRQRGVDYERSINEEYLQRLSDAYVRFFYNYQHAPLLIVNATEANFAEGEADYQRLLGELNDLRSGRHYFNPLPI
jgi:deoxyadenosine/deoxycytidine kinase